MDERPDNSEQLMDILLVMDQEKKTIQAVSGVKDGELQTKNPLEDNNDLLRVDRHGDMFSNFFSNLWNQLKDPTRFHFFRVPEEDVQRVAADFQQTVQNPTPEGQARMAQYEVQHPAQAQQQGEQQAQPAAGQQQQQPTDAPQQGQAQQQPQYKYDVEKIDWNSLANLGIKREQIEQNGMLDQMLRGFQTDKTVRVYFNLDSISHANDSQLSLREAPDGRVVVCSHGILDPQKLQQQFFGHTFTKEDSDAIKTVGNMGRIVELTNRAGEKVPSLVSRNQKTNELASFPADKVRIPAEKNGHTFTPDEVARLKKGEAVVCKFQTKAKEGQKPKTYEAPVQFNAAKMQLELLFNDRAKLAMDAHKELQKQTSPQDLPQAGTYRKVANGTCGRRHGQSFRLERQERKTLSGVHHMAARTEIPRLHVPQGLQDRTRRGACQTRRRERGTGSRQFRGQDHRSHQEPERSLAGRTNPPHRRAEGAARPQAGTERGQERR